MEISSFAPYCATIATFGLKSSAVFDVAQFREVNLSVGWPARAELLIQINNAAAVPGEIIFARNFRDCGSSMCFSATGSFAAAALNGVAGIATLRKTAGTAEAPLGAIPLVFAAQQTLEGILWLMLPLHAGHPIVTQAAANSFVVIALVIWPVLAPLAVAMVEPNRGRRRAIHLLLALGIALAAYFAWHVYLHPYRANVVGHSISYINGEIPPILATMTYAIVVCGSLLLCSEKILRVLGSLIFVGLAISAIAFLYAFVSVWCFFAALASGLIFARTYFPVLRRPSPQRAS